MDNKNESSTSRLNFGGDADPAKEKLPETSGLLMPQEAQAEEAVTTTAQTSEEIEVATDREAELAQTQAEETVSAVEPTAAVEVAPDTIDNAVVAEDVDTSVVIDGSQADLQSDVAKELAKHAEGTAGEGDGSAAVPVEEEFKAPTFSGASDGKSVEDLRAEQDRLNAQINAKLEAERASVIDQIKVVVEQFKIPVDVLVEALGGMPKKTRKSSGTVKPKYRNPADPSQTWTGRGKAPLWIKDKKKEDFLITE